jgi:anti-sigma-K factor RskA
VNIKDYISTGILEAYVLGELSDVERSEVEKLLREHPALREELLRVEEVQERFLMASAIEPRVSLKNEILKSIEQRSPQGKIVSMSLWELAAAASIAVALVASYLAVDYRSKWKRSETDLTSLIAQNQQMAQNYNQVNDRINRMENDLKVMDNPKFQRVVMTATPTGMPEAMASVYWNASSKEVFLRIQNLKELANDQQYQLWAIIDGKPVDAGVFDRNMAGLVKMKEISKGAAMFAVTIEPRGGRSNPTMKTMQVAGNVQKS